MLRPPPKSTLFPYTTLFRSDRSWGYNPAYFFTPEASYGSANDLKRLIDAAHQKGIGVLLDMVFKDRKSTRLNSSHQIISYAVFCLKKKRKYITTILKRTRTI